MVLKLNYLSNQLYCAPLIMAIQTLFLRNMAQGLIQTLLKKKKLKISGDINKNVPKSWYAMKIRIPKWFYFFLHDFFLLEWYLFGSQICPKSFPNIGHLTPIPTKIYKDIQNVQIDENDKEISNIYIYIKGKIGGLCNSNSNKNILSHISLSKDIL